jgi:hypothetical protein
MPTLTINGTVIDFPDSSASPNWAPAIIAFAEAVEGALALSGGTYDVTPQSFTIDSYNAASNIDIPALAFPTSAVRSAFIRYSVYRSTDSNSAYEAGDMIIVYNANNSSGHKWALSQGNITGSGAQITFNVTDAGQIQFSTTSISGSNHVGKIGFEARSLEQS